MIKIAIFTKNELRHKFFRHSLSNYKDVEVIYSLIEKTNLKLNYQNIKKKNEIKLSKKHFKLRAEKEKIYFQEYLKNNIDYSNPINISSNKINNINFHKKITKNKMPDYVFAFGCSILNEKIIKYYKGKIINYHLGLSPYFRGSGTNFWPLVLNKPEYIGLTIMKMNKGIDTGEIIHQIRPNIEINDDVHSIGCKVVYDIVNSFYPLIKSINRIPSHKIYKKSFKYYFKRNDFNYLALKKLYSNLKNNLLNKYLKNKSKKDKKVKIIKNMKIKLYYK